MPLFKYMPEVRIDDILVLNKIRFTQPICFNDPFECKLTIDNMASDEDIQNFHKENFEKLLKEEYDKNNAINSVLSYEQFLLLSETKKESILDSLKEINSSECFIQQLRNKFEEILNYEWGILSLTTSKDNLLMWAHYANEHKGFTVEFSEKSNFFHKREDKKSFFNHLHKVNYSSYRDYKDLSKKQFEEVFLTKSIEWEYEEEYRVFKQLSSANEVKNENIYLFNFPKDMIKAIYCGCNMDKVHKEKILNIISNDIELSHVKLYYGEISTKYYKINFNEINKVT
ncbi:DUF2971 domain-containing protein [Halarcobacter sp.]|uniref:DUF2971 domain-containing protein n=1 Tax=Halarcobacter sp. TaxID=2321133 RepID=UPI003AFFA9B2